MRYVGSDDTFTYLKCDRCKKVHAYNTALLEKRKGKCNICGAQYRFILFHPVSMESVIPWIPPIFMFLFSAFILYLLSFSPLLSQLKFNRLVTTSNSLITSISISILGSLASFLLYFWDSKSSTYKYTQILSLLFTLIEGVALVFLMNQVIESNFNSLQIRNPDTNETQQYFGSIVGECATGQGRLFDNHGNLIYYGGFSNSLYDGYGEKYESLNTIHGSNLEPDYKCVYKGEFANGLPSGQGKEYRYDAEYIFEKEDSESPNLYYEGEFLDGKYCGHGILYGINSKYQGGFFDGKYNGYGNKWFLDFSDSKIYRVEGYFSDGFLNGAGTKYYPSGQILFTGDYVNGDGVSGIFYFENGNIRYNGGIVDAKKYNGTGTLYWENGNIRYSGEWSKNSREGKGVSFCEDGTKEYDGCWHENERSEYGTEYYPGGILPRYAGRWKRDKWNGYGEEYDENGTLVREGVWKGGKLDGEGTWYWGNNNIRYEGNFYQGDRSGYGISYWENGKEEYKGDWVDDKFSGKGEWYWITGNLYFKGNFENGDIVGYGSTYSKDGILTYEGNFFNGLRNGEGTSYWPNGEKQYIGSWVDDKYSGKGKMYSMEGKLLHEGNFLQGNFIS